MIGWHRHLIVSSPSNRKLLVSINQSSYLTYLCYNVFDRQKEKKYETKSIRLRLLTLTCFIFLLLFSKKPGFIEEDKPSENVVIVEEELNHFDIDGIENLENLPSVYQ